MLKIPSRRPQMRIAVWDADRQQCIDKFKPLGINRCRYEIPTTEWTHDETFNFN